MTGKGAKKFEAKLEAPRIYKDAIQARLADPKSSDAVMRCANALGTLAGVLVVQRRLDLLKYEFPEINRCHDGFQRRAGRFQSTDHHPHDHAAGCLALCRSHLRQ